MTFLLALLLLFSFAYLSFSCLYNIQQYGYYDHQDPFLIASNIPGFLTSLWLNFGAAKLQYLHALEDHAEMEQIAAQEAAEAALSQHDAALARASSSHNHTDDHNDDDREIAVELEEPLLMADESSVASSRMEEEGSVFAKFTMVPQERNLSRVLLFWAAIILFCRFGAPNRADAKTLVGLVVNVNLVFFYGAPLQTMRTVVTTGNSASIHRPTLYMNWACSSFWTLYGVTQLDPVILFPNAIGLSLGVAQGILAAMYPVSHAAPERRQSLLLADEVGDMGP